MLKKLHRFLQRNSSTYKWGYFKFFINVILLGRYHTICIKDNKDNIQSIILFKKVNDCLFSQEIVFNFSTLTEEETALYFKLYLEAFKLFKYNSIVMVLKDYQKIYERFLTSKLGEDFNFEVDLASTAKAKISNISHIHYKLKL